MVGATDEYDVMLAFIEPTHEPRKGAKLAQRLDGIWFKPEQFHPLNRGIKACYNRADLVIWQSGFDREMTKFHWGAPKKGKVIHNGIDTTPVPAITIPNLQALRDDHEMLFVCSSNWHPQKRLHDNIELFNHLKANFYPSSALIVMGSGPDAIGDSSVHYTGNVNQQTYLQVMSAANWMIHLAWLDHCPNVVIESLSQGTPVICSCEGGTKELVGGYGVILDEEPYGFELVDYDNPPRIDVTQIAAPLPAKEQLHEHANIDIERAAAAYEKALEGILR
jgi:glycosyltransferase involved in cell wall biosynthesis